jgi:hypothetical protein
MAKLITNYYTQFTKNKEIVDGLFKEHGLPEADRVSFWNRVIQIEL